MKKQQNLRIHSFLVILMTLTCLSANAKVFKNAYIAFEMPDQWNCILEQTEWVCRSTSEKEAREAIIILTAKEVGPTDSFDAYAAHLANIQPRPGIAANTEAKVVYQPKRTKINDQEWIDGLQLGSEIPNYFTRYLATIKDRIAVLVTFSAHKNHYTKYSQDFYKSVMSLRVIASKNILAKPEMGPIRPGSETLGAPISSAMPADMMTEEMPSEPKGKNKIKLLMMALGALLLGAGLFLYFKKK